MAWQCKERIVKKEIKNYKETELCLHIFIGSRACSFFVLHKDKLLALASYVLEIETTEADSKLEDCARKLGLDQFSSLLEIEALLDPKWKFKSTSYTVDFENYSLVPKKYFPYAGSKNIGSTSIKAIDISQIAYKKADYIISALYGKQNEDFPISNVEENSEALPKSLNSLSSNNIIFIENISKLKSFSIVAVEKHIVERMESIYHNINYTSSLSILLERIYKKTNKKHKHNIILNLRKPFLDIIIRTSSEIVLCNKFHYSNFQTLLFYLLYSANLYKVDMGQCHLEIIGDDLKENEIENLQMQFSKLSHNKYIYAYS